MRPLYANLVGTPYEKLDCWGVVKEFYRLMFSIELKSYMEGKKPIEPGDVKSLIYSKLGDFYRVTGNYEFGDIVLIKLFDIECHIGVYLGQNLFIHSARNVGCVIDKMDKWMPRTTGFFRHREETTT